MCVIKAHLRGDPTILTTFKAKSKFVYPIAPADSEGPVYIKWYACRVYNHSAGRESAESEWGCAGLTSEGTVILYDMGVRSSEEAAVRRAHSLTDSISFLRYYRLDRVFKPIKLGRPYDAVMSIKVCVL